MSVHEEGPNYIWQDREIRFDAKVGLLNPRKGEVQIDSINSVDDKSAHHLGFARQLQRQLEYWIEHSFDGEHP
jgi:hypothetical protein